MPPQLFKICSLHIPAVLFPPLTVFADAALGHLPGACVHSTALNAQSGIQRTGDLFWPVDWRLWLGSSKGELRHPVETSVNGHKITNYQLLGEI